VSDKVPGYLTSSSYHVFRIAAPLAITIAIMSHSLLLWGIAKVS
jgi:hypothetical protein